MRTQPPVGLQAALADADRLAAVRRVMGVEDEALVMRTTVDLAADLLEAPSAVVQLVGRDRLVSVASGSDLVERLDDPLSGEGWCSEVVAACQPVVVPDAGGHGGATTPPAVKAGHLGAYVGVPLVSGSGHAIGLLCVVDAAPRPDWGERETSVLVRLARSVVAELELRAVSAELRDSAARLELALDAAEIGSFDLDVESGELLWDQRLVRMFGYEEEGFVPHLDSFNRRVHPDDLAQVADSIAAAVRGEADLDVEYRIVPPGGQVRWVAARGRVVRSGDAGTRLLGAALDITDARDSRERVARVLETMTNAFYSVDRDWRFTYVNRQAEQLLGRRREELLGRSVWEEFPAAADPTSQFWQQYQRAMREREPVRFEEHYPAPLDAWYEASAWPTPDGLSVYFQDITERRRAEQERAAAYARLDLLSRVTGALVSTLDPDEAMGRLARLAVPWLADWAAVKLVDDTGELRHAVAMHRDPDRQADLERFCELHVRHAKPSSHTRVVARTGKPVLRPALDEAEAASGWDVEELTTLLRRIGCSTLMVVPLESRGRVLGVLVLAGTGDRPPYGQRDLGTAVELAQRAALAVDNAQLFARQRTVAETMQRSLLTTVPEPDHLHITARYLPAARESAVGGDWHDAHLQPDGSTVLSIGDVMGHDVDAAAAMGQIRTLLRGISVYSEASPAAVLRGVDDAMRVLAVRTLATAVVVRIEADDDLRARGLRRLRWSNAGHPPPLLLRADGRVELLHRDRDLLLGLDPQTERVDHELLLAPGDTLLLYTDGLVERRDLPLESGLQQLADLVAGRERQPLDALCDDVLGALLPASPDDDVAMVAVRARRQDQPSAPEAGPDRVPGPPR